MKRQLAVLIATLLLLGACRANPTPMPTYTPVPTAPPAQPTEVVPVDATTAQTVTIEMIDMAYNPKSVRIKAGTTVTWVNKDVIMHSATSDTRLWDSGYLQRGDTFSYTFTQPGTYKYHSALPAASGTTGEITVVE